MGILAGHSMEMFIQIRMLSMACKLLSGCRGQAATYSKGEHSHERLLYSWAKHVTPYM